MQANPLAGAGAGGMAGGAGMAGGMAGGMGGGMMGGGVRQPLSLLLAVVKRSLRKASPSTLMAFVDCRDGRPSAHFQAQRLCWAFLITRARSQMMQGGGVMMGGMGMGGVGMGGGGLGAGGIGGGHTGEQSRVWYQREDLFSNDWKAVWQWEPKMVARWVGVIEGLEPYADNFIVGDIDGLKLLQMGTGMDGGFALMSVGITSMGARAKFMDEVNFISERSLLRLAARRTAHADCRCAQRNTVCQSTCTDTSPVRTATRATSSLASGKDCGAS